MDENPYEAPQFEHDGKPINWLDVFFYSSLALVFSGYMLLGSVGVVMGLTFDDAVREWPVDPIGATCMFAGWAGVFLVLIFGTKYLNR